MGAGTAGGKWNAVEFVRNTGTASFPGAFVAAKGAAGQSMAALNLIRDSGWADYFRAYRILLDGKQICEVRNGETKLVFVSPGEHSLAVRVDWGGMPGQYTQIGFLRADNCELSILSRLSRLGFPG